MGFFITFYLLFTLSVFLVYFSLVAAGLMSSISGLKDFKKGYVLPFIPGYSLDASSPSGAAYRTPSATRAVVEDGPST